MPQIRFGLAVHACALALCALALSSCDDDCPAGNEGCACFGNMTCQGELSCASGFCVDFDGAGDGGGKDGGGNGASNDGGPIGDPTRSDASANAGRGGGARDGGGNAGNNSQAGSGGQAGGDAPQGAECETTADCAPLEDLCRIPVCLAGVCDDASKPEGTRIDDPIPGDCKQLRCDRGGEIAAVADPADVPEDDGDPCTVSSCDGLDPVHMPAAAGTPTPASSQTDGDCLRVVCDGEGGVTSVADDQDPPPAPGNEPCRVGSCEDGSTATGPAPPGTPCGNGSVCDAEGDCVGCKADNSGCSASAECCSGWCREGACTTCQAGTKDCDGNPDNGCETSITTTLNCQGCGNDCSGRPNVATTTCAAEGCKLSRCAGRHADVDGAFDNGCEAAATVSSAGPYARCTAANAASVCGVGERCMGLLSSGGFLITLTNCSSSSSSCFCAHPCSTAQDCPAAPPGGTAAPTCGSNFCQLSCSGTVNCPTGMMCPTSALPLYPPVCMWN